MRVGCRRRLPMRRPPNPCAGPQRQTPRSVVPGFCERLRMRHGCYAVSAVSAVSGSATSPSSVMRPRSCAILTFRVRS